MLKLKNLKAFRFKIKKFSGNQVISHKISRNTYVDQISMTQTTSKRRNLRRKRYFSLGSEYADIGKENESKMLFYKIYYPIWLNRIV